MNDLLMNKKEKNEPFIQMIKISTEKVGKKLLSDTDLLILSAKELLHTYTYKEKKYSE